MMITPDDIHVLYSEEDLQKRIKALAEELNKHYNGEEIFAVCVLKGSVMFFTDLVKHLTMPLKMEFIRLSSYGSNYSSSGKVKAVNLSLPDINDKNVLIVEDIIDTGHTAKFLLDFIGHNFKTKSTKFCSLLNIVLSSPNQSLLYTSRVYTLSATSSKQLSYRLAIMA